MPSDALIQGRSSIDGKAHGSTWLLIAFAATSSTLIAQNIVTPQPAPGKPILQRNEATDPLSGNHYVRLLLSLPAKADTDQNTQPRFTIQCEDVKGKHQMLWFLSFGGVEDPGYERPFRQTQGALYPPVYPAVNLKMTFEGYIKFKPFTRSWALLPTGELRYRNSGTDGPNMEPARWFLQYLSVLPGLRVAYAKPQKGDPGEILFPMQPLLDELNKTPICSP